MKINHIITEFVTPQATAQDPGLEREKDVDVIFYGQMPQDFTANTVAEALEEVLPREYPPGSSNTTNSNVYRVVTEIAKHQGAVVTNKPLSIAQKLVKTFQTYGIKCRIDAPGLEEGWKGTLAGGALGLFVGPVGALFGAWVGHKLQEKIKAGNANTQRLMSQGKVFQVYFDAQDLYPGKLFNYIDAFDKMSDLAKKPHDIEKYFDVVDSKTGNSVFKYRVKLDASNFLKKMAMDRRDELRRKEKQNQGLEEAGTREGALNTCIQLNKAIKNSKGMQPHEVDLLKRQLAALMRKYNIRPEELIEPADTQPPPNRPTDSQKSQTSVNQGRRKFMQNVKDWGLGLGLAGAGMAYKHSQQKPTGSKSGDVDRNNSLLNPKNTSPEKAPAKPEVDTEPNYVKPVDPSASNRQSMDDLDNSEKVASKAEVPKWEWDDEFIDSAIKSGKITQKNYDKLISAGIEVATIVSIIKDSDKVIKSAIESGKITKTEYDKIKAAGYDDISYAKYIKDNLKEGVAEAARPPVAPDPQNYDSDWDYYNDRDADDMTDSDPADDMTDDESDDWFDESREKVGNMDADAFDDALARLKKLAGAGPLRTVYDPARRVYKNVPHAVQPAQQPKKAR